MLEALVSSRIRRALFGHILTHPHDRFYLRGLAKELDVSISPLRRELKRLEQSGMLRTAKEANILFYTVETESPAFLQLHQAAGGNGGATNGSAETAAGAAEAPKPVTIPTTREPESQRPTVHAHPAVGPDPEPRPCPQPRPSHTVITDYPLGHRKPSLWDRPIPGSLLIRVGGLCMPIVLVLVGVVRFSGPYQNATIAYRLSPRAAAPGLTTRNEAVAMVTPEPSTRAAMAQNAGATIGQTPVAAPAAGMQTTEPILSSQEIAADPEVAAPLEVEAIQTAAAIPFEVIGEGVEVEAEAGVVTLEWDGNVIRWEDFVAGRSPEYY